MLAVFLCLHLVGIFAVIVTPSSSHSLICMLRTRQLCFVRLSHTFFKPNNKPASVSLFSPSSWEHTKEIAKKNSIPMERLYKIRSKQEKFKYITDPGYINPLPINERINAKPSVGSIVEYISPESKSTRFGVIVSDDANFFQLNHYKVFVMNDSTDDYLEDIITTDQINFHLNQFVKPKLLYQSLAQVEGYTKATLNQFLKDIFLKSYHIVKEQSHLIPVAQAHYSQLSVPQQLDLLDITLSIASKISSSRNRPVLEFLMLGLHVHLQTDACNFAVSKDSNSILDTLESSLIPNNLKYFVNSVRDSEVMEYAFELSQANLSEINTIFKDFLRSSEQNETTYSDYLRDPSSFKDIHSIITLMERYLKFAPTSQVVSTLASVLDGITSVSPESIFQILNELRVYPDSTVQIHSYPASDPIQLSTSSKDNFNHLRQNYSAIAYGFPSLKLFDQFQHESFSEFAISLDTTNSDIWELSIHIPDIASTINSSDEIISLLETKIRDFHSPFQVQSLFDLSSLKHASFREGSNDNKAITVTVYYSLDPTKRWNDTKVSVSLTNLENLRIVPISEFNEIWKSRVPNLNRLNISNFFKRLFSAGQYSKNQAKLTEDDVDKLNHFLTMIDYWFFKRIQTHGSLENPFPRRSIFELTEEQSILKITDYDKNYSYANYITKEIELILSEELSKYAKATKDLVLVSKNQSILKDSVMDSVEIISTTQLPNYKTSKFNELIYLKDEMMLTPYQNFVTALQFLKPVEIRTTKDTNEFVLKGLDSGFIEFLKPFTKYEVILNHWQVLNHLQKMFLKSLASYPQKFQDFELTELYPKSTIPKDLNSEQLLNYYNLKVKPQDHLMRQIELNQDRYTTLRYIEQQQSKNTTNWNIYRCIMLNLKSSRIASAWCFELGIQVDIELNEDYGETTYQIGDQIICNQIIYLNAVQSMIILKN